MGKGNAELVHVMLLLVFLRRLFPVCMYTERQKYPGSLAQVSCQGDSQTPVRRHCLWGREGPLWCRATDFSLYNLSELLYISTMLNYFCYKYIYIHMHKPYIQNHVYRWPHTYVSMHTCLHTGLLLGHTAQLPGAPSPAWRVAPSCTSWHKSLTNSVPEYSHPRTGHR